MPEKIPTSEWSEAERQLIQALREKGVEDPETRALLQKWAEGEETKAEAATQARVEASIAFERKRAKLYLEAGFVNEALDALEDARMQAHQIQNQELYNVIMAEMDRIEDESAEKK